MLDVLSASPSVGSHRCDPMTTSEIDAHPDRDRIWSTVKAMGGEIDEARQQGYEEGAGDVDAAISEECSRCEEELDKWTDGFIENAEDMTAQEIRDALIATDWSEVLK
ncbi:hypothetical protein [Tranquillimonas rosea]|uniref:hypothetical protein n=1 Tax=Tranquillimonas rosea TaxID=641238 RepID=UPI003BAAB609